VNSRAWLAARRVIRKHLVELVKLGFHNPYVRPVRTGNENRALLFDCSFVRRGPSNYPKDAKDAKDGRKTRKTAKDGRKTRKTAKDGQFNNTEDVK
jgi:hypothetical protein